MTELKNTALTDEVHPEVPIHDKYPSALLEPASNLSKEVRQPGRLPRAGRGSEVVLPVGLVGRKSENREQGGQMLSTARIVSAGGGSNGEMSQQRINICYEDCESRS